MTTPILVTVADLQAHLRLPVVADESPATPEQMDLQRKLDAATELVCNYIADRNPADEDWIATIESWTIGGSPGETPPQVVVLAVLEQAATFYRFRGDDDKTPEERGYLAPGVENLLSAYKNRAFA